MVLNCIEAKWYESQATICRASGAIDLYARMNGDSNAAMLPDLVLFKGRHIAWKKEQKQGFFQPKKNIFISIFSPIVHILDKIFKNS